MKRITINMLFALSLFFTNSVEIRSNNTQKKEEMNQNSISPVVVKIAPNNKYLSFQNKGIFHLINLKNYRQQKIDMHEGVLHFNFSPNGDFLLISTPTKLIRFCLKKKWETFGSIEFSMQSKIRINNEGDVVIFTIPDFINNECMFYLWRSDTNEFSLKENKLGFFEPNQVMYNGKNQTILLDGINTSYHPEMEMRKKETHKFLTISNENVLHETELTEEDLIYLKGTFYYPFKTNNIITHLCEQNALNVLDQNLNIKTQIPIEKLKTNSNIQDIALSPSNNYMAIRWSEWDGENDRIFINTVDCNTYDVIMQTPITEDMTGFESFSVSDKKKVLYAHPDLKTKEINLFKLKDGKARLIKKIKIKK